MKTNSKTQKGFSTVELIIYSAAMSIFLGIAGLILIGVYDFYGNVAAITEVDGGSYFLINKISGEISSATKLISSESRLNDDDGILVYEIISDEVTSLRKIFVEDGKIFHEIDGQKFKMFSGSSFRITGLNFSLYENTISKAISIDLKIEYQTRKYGAVSQHFSNFVILRNLYE